MPRGHKVVRPSAWQPKVLKPEVTYADCHVCGGRGRVPRGYVDSTLGIQEARQEISCPKCCSRQ